MLKKVTPIGYTIEIIVIVITIIIWLLNQKHSLIGLETDILVDLSILSGFVASLISHSHHPRQFWYGFTLLCLTASFNILGAESFSSFLASLTLGQFILSFINLLIFTKSETD